MVIQTVCISLDVSALIGALITGLFYGDFAGSKPGFDAPSLSCHTKSVTRPNL